MARGSDGFIVMSSSTTQQIVLTGASRGLGRAMTEGFIRLGHVVHGCARDVGKVAELSKAFGAPNSFTVVNVSDDAAVARWAREVFDRAGPPDLLINNAAVVAPNAPLWETSDRDVRASVEINIVGVANVIRHFAPAMIAKRRGVIVNFSSGWGRSVSPEVATYCATKWAIEGLTKALAEELPKGMAAVPLNPGIIDTDMLRSAFGDAAGSYPSPDRWAQRAVPFLLQLGAKDNGKSLSAPGG